MSFIEIAAASFVGTLAALAVFAIPTAYVLKKKLSNLNPFGGLNP